MNTDIRADLNPQGWREWRPGETQRLATAYYAEYRSTGRTGEMTAREPHAHALSDSDAAEWSMTALLAGSDHWLPDLTR